MSAKSSSRDGVKPSLIAVHTNEGPNPADVFPDRTAENLCRWMDDQEVSYHKVVDDDSVVHYVPDDRASWALRSGNRRSLNICFMGYSRFSRNEWMRHEGMLKLGSIEVRSWSDRYSIPARKLQPHEVRADQSGICGHVDWTLGKNDGGHTDPGGGFPWDYFLSLIYGNLHIPAGTPPFPLPPGHYFGLVSGPKESHGGYYGNERPSIKLIQQALIRKGYVPGLSNPDSGWADGVYGPPTFDSVVRFQKAEMPQTTRFGEVWQDDWAKLLS